MISARTEKERLKALIGLDGPDNLHNSLKKDDFTKQQTSLVELPNSLELVHLLQKQDEVINELYSQLELCKDEIFMLKDHNNAQTEENRKVFEELRAQILKQNLAKAFGQPTVIGTKSDQESIIHQNLRQCQKCEILSNTIKTKEKDKQLVQNKLKTTIKDLNDLKSKEKEYLQRVNQAVKLADQSLLEKTELSMHFKHSQQKIDELTTEMKNLLIEQKSSIKNCQENAHAQYSTEIEHLKNQVTNLLSKEQLLIEENELLKKENESSKQELGDFRTKSKQLETEIEKKITTQESSFHETLKEQKELEKSMKHLQHKYDLETTSHKQKITTLEETLSEKSAQFQQSQTTLKMLKTDNSELRERLALREKDLSNLRYLKRRLETDNENLMQKSTAELRDTLRMANLKQEQTRTELESLLFSQNSLISKLKEECKFLNERLARILKEHKRDAKTMKKQKQNAKQNESSSS